MLFKTVRGKYANSRSKIWTNDCEADVSNQKSTILLSRSIYLWMLITEPRGLFWTHQLWPESVQQWERRHRSAGTAAKQTERSKKKSHQNAIRTKSVSTAQYFALKHPVVWPWAIQKRCQWKEDAWALWRRTLLGAPPLPPASPSPCLSVNCRSPEMTCKHIYIHHNLNLDKSMDMDKYLIN